MANALHRQPWFVLLLPVFFVLHGCAENFGFIKVADAFILVLVYIVAAVLCYLLFLLFFKDRIRAALITFYLFAVNFFFGAIQDFLKIHLVVLNRYSVLVPLFVILFVGLIIYLRNNKRSFSKLTLFLTLLLLIFIVVDLGSIILKEINPPGNKLSVYSFPKDSAFTTCADCDKPDIYFLLFDEYASSASLKNDFNYDNSAFDTFLINEGFHIQRKSKGNYNFTPFSMASILNMSYINGIDPAQVSIEDYARCNELIRSNAVINFLSNQGYEIVNYSIFDLAGNPSMIRQDFLPLKTKLVTDGTLLSRVRKDLAWIVLEGKFKIDWLAGRFFYDNMHNNEKVLAKLKKSSATVAGSPRFIYAHLFMPHPPFYFDKNGKLKEGSKILSESKEMNTDAYLDYVTYTNSRITELVTTIIRNTGGKAVVIFMGDHGFRKLSPAADEKRFFENQNAVYFPGKSYGMLYDSITGVNQFRVVFNTLFRQHFPMLKDSTIFLIDKK